MHFFGFNKLLNELLIHACTCKYFQLLLVLYRIYLSFFIHSINQHNTSNTMAYFVCCQIVGSSNQTTRKHLRLLSLLQMDIVDSQKDRKEK